MIFVIFWDLKAEVQKPLWLRLFNVDKLHDYAFLDNHQAYLELTTVNVDNIFDENRDREIFEFLEFCVQFVLNIDVSTER